VGVEVKLSTNNDRNRYMIFMAEQPLPLEVTCEPWKEPRKLTANAYLWAFVYKPLVEIAGHTSDDWHVHFCGEHFGWREHVLPSGNVEYRPVRTTTTNEAGGRDVLKGEPFNDFLMFVESECAKRGVFIEREFAV
jgi:hypothetical protein